MREEKYINIVEEKYTKENKIIGTYTYKKKWDEYKKENMNQFENVEFFIRETLLTDYPFFIVETFEIEDVKTYKYLDYTALVNLINLIKKEESKDFYYNAYFVRDPFFTNNLDESVLYYFYNVKIDNRFLETYDYDDGKKTINEALLSAMAYNFDIHSMERNYNELKTDESVFLKESLLDAYIDMLCQMQYDFACSKLGDEGLKALLPTVEIIESLGGKSFHNLKSDVFITLMEANKDKHVDIAITYCKKAIKSLEEYIKEEEELQHLYRNLSRCFLFLSEKNKNVPSWIKAKEWIKKSLKEAPIEGDWFAYFEMLYVKNYDWEELNALKLSEINNLSNFVKSIATNLDIYIVIATHFKSVLDVTKNYSFEKEYLFYLNASLLQPLSQNFHALKISEIGHFYHNEGIRLGRIDLLEKALEYHMLINTNEDLSTLSVYYVAQDYVNISKIYLEQDKTDLARDNLQKAANFYSINFEHIKKTYSALLHYFEFLVDCYCERSEIELLPIKKVKEIGNMTIKLGEGFYSAPYFLMAEIALFEDEEDLAIALLTRSCILHELCIDAEIIAFKENKKDSKFLNLNNFLDETIDFMEKAAENYYLDPKIKWSELKEMDDDMVLNQWQIVKADIEKRGSK